jgi:hypothetical protein
MLLLVRLRIDLCALTGGNDGNPEYAVLSVRACYDEVQLSKLMYFKSYVRVIRHAFQPFDQPAFSERVFGYFILPYLAARPCRLIRSP